MSEKLRVRVTAELVNDSGQVLRGFRGTTDLITASWAESGFYHLQERVFPFDEEIFDLENEEQ